MIRARPVRPETPAPVCPGESRGTVPSQPVQAFFARHRDRLAYVHAAFFVLFMVLIFGPVFLPEPPSSATAFSHLTTFANYVLWGLWFPLVFLSVIVTGRSWCGLMCPMGAAAEWANGVGLQRPIPALLRWEGMPIVSFLLVTVMGQTLGVRDHPEAVAMVFGTTMGAAILTGLLFGRRRRAWCRHLCPIGLLLGVFSRLGAVEFAPKNPQPGGDAYAERGACPMMIDLARKQESRHCIECFRCVNPKAKGGLEVRMRRPGLEIERIRDYHPNPVEVWFLFLGTGIALGGFLWLVLPAYQDLRQWLGEWVIGQGWLWLGEPGPYWLMSVHPERREVFVWLDFLLIAGFMLGVMAAMTAVLATTTYAAARLSGPTAGLGRRFGRLGYQYAPVAMTSLVVGIGGALFTPLAVVAGAGAAEAAKIALVGTGLAWSLWLGWRILAAEPRATGVRLIALLPGALGSVAVAASWWVAIFGLPF